jgi:hypothetical protein
MEVVSNNETSAYFHEKTRPISQKAVIFIFAAVRT